MIALVIDDNKQTAEALVQMLKIWNISARPAYGPGAAMKILARQPPISFSLILICPVWMVLKYWPICGASRA